MVENQKILIYVSKLLTEINDKFNFYTKIEDQNLFRKILFDCLEQNQNEIQRIIHSKNDMDMKRFLFNNFIKPTYFPEYNNVQVISSKPVPTKPIIKTEIKKEVIEEAKRGKGRPKGSKNKPKDIIVNIPTHSVYDQNFLEAVKDILWYRPGITAKTIVDHLDCDESIIALIYGKISQYTNVYWRESKIRNRYGKVITLYYPIGERKGYYYEGKLRSITNMAECISMNKVTLWKRIKSGMNHIEAINKPIDDKMIRNGKNS
jgi:hypothetical protein